MPANKTNLGVAGKFRKLHNNITFEQFAGDCPIEILSNIEAEDGTIAASRRVMLMARANIPDVSNALVSVHAIDENAKEALCEGIQRKNRPSVKGSPLLSGNISSILNLDGQGGYVATLKFFFKELSSHHNKMKFAVCVVVSKANNIHYAGKTPYFEVRDRLKGSGNSHSKPSNTESRPYKKRKREEKDSDNRKDKEVRLTEDRIADTETKPKRRHSDTLIETRTLTEKSQTAFSPHEKQLSTSRLHNSKEAFESYILLHLKNGKNMYDGNSGEEFFDSNNNLANTYPFLDCIVVREKH